MTTPDTQRAALIERLHELFRVKGYEGVSIGEVSEATGLGRSSLYHYFPRGKEQMAEAVVAFTNDALAQSVLAPLGADTPLPSRIDAMLAAVNSIYAAGQTPCLLASLLTSAPERGPLAAGAARALTDWIDAIAACLAAAGTEPDEAQRRATLALGQIQGALVLARALARPAPFADALAAARATLLGASS